MISSIPIVPSQILSLYVDLGVIFGWENTVFKGFHEDDTITKSYSDSYAFGIRIDPNITFFVMENFAIELDISILGYNYEMCKTTENELSGQKNVSQSIDLKLNKYNFISIILHRKKIAKVKYFYSNSKVYLL